MIKKLKDLTEEEYKTWLKKNCKIGSICKDCLFGNVKCAIPNNSCWIKHKDLFSNKFLNQEIEIESISILDDTEKSYLSAVIRPFRDRIQHIVKFSYFDSTEFLAFILKDTTGSYDENMCLPSFKKRTMYRGMEKDKMYTLKELDL